MLDASLTSVPDFKHIILHETNKIILTSVTIFELDKIQKFSDESAFNARFLLNYAAEDPDKFLNVSIDETIGTPDDCIIKYCQDNKDSVTLLTADKVMTLKARMNQIRVSYYCNHTGLKTEATKMQTEKKQIFKKSCQRSRCTLQDAEWLPKNKMILNIRKLPKKKIILFSSNQVLDSGIHELKIGDELFISTKKDSYVTFSHYEIVSTTKENNCKMIFSTRIQDESDIETLPLLSYKFFLTFYVNNHLKNLKLLKKIV